MTRKEYNLPKPYLSYSQLDLWLKNKEQYRQRYYLNGPAFENTETIFGKKTAQMLEDNISDPVLSRVPRYKFPEYRIELEVGGVPFLGVLDSFSKYTKRILEFKTGKEPWNDVRVRKHNQLVVYSLLVKLKHKKVNPEVKLVWIETEYKPVMDTIGSITCERDGGELSFTGKVKIFKRKIAEWERKKMVETIRRVAQEISDDYTQFQKTL